MGTTTITITVDNDLARIYYNATAEERQKIEAIVRLWLQDLAESNRLPLSDLMDTISDRAQARGLTPEILDTLLDDDE
jgi:hypothetical protein